MGGGGVLRLHVFSVILPWKLTHSPTPPPHPLDPRVNFLVENMFYLNKNYQSGFNNEYKYYLLVFLFMYIDIQYDSKLIIEKLVRHT